jgi:FkbM family methyltransferase
MITSQIRRTVSGIKRRLRGDANRYLRSCSGVIHVGANIGQEAPLYAQFGIPVVWIEPLAPQFETLRRSIEPHSQQIAIKALITDRDGDTHTLHVANNNGQSSSIYELSLHKDIWPEVNYVGDVTMVSSTLPSALRSANVDVNRFDALVMDTQGSELLVLKGAEPILNRFRYIKTEAADFDSYRGCATIGEIGSFLDARGFSIVRKDKFAQHPSGGQYFDVLFKRKIG